VSEANDVAYWLDRMALPNARDRVETLKQIAEAPIADARLLAAAEQLMDDREICIVQIPYRFGEVRFFAADAVAALRRLLGGTQPVILTDTFFPLTADDVSSYASAAGIERRNGGIEGEVETLRELRERSALTTRTITR